MNEDQPLRIDGSRGEGGGQILRTALTLGVVTGRRLHFVRIREGRPQPGLRAQHLASIEAAASISAAAVEGARIGSREVRFDPGPVRPGRYRFRIGTAGSASLVIQTVALPLAMAPGPSEVEVTGGTHVSWSPSAHYVRWHWAPFLSRIGVEVEVETEAVGFFPRGGGRLVARVGGGGRPRPWTAPERGALREARGEVTIARLPGSIADRIVREADRLLSRQRIRADLEVREVSSPGPGVAFDILARFEPSGGGAGPEGEGVRFAATALGRRGLPAERLAAGAVGDLVKFLEGGATVDRHLADQAVGPLSVAPGTSRMRTAAVTRHLMTNAGTIALLLGDRVEIGGGEEEEAEVVVRGIES